jgi:hypothetical protein
VPRLSSRAQEIFHRAWPGRYIHHMGLSLVASMLVLALEMTPEVDAAIQHDRDKEFAAIDHAYGDRAPSQLTQDERREIIHQQQDAEQRVLDEHGADAKTVARYEAKMSLRDRAVYQAELYRLEQLDPVR